MVAAGHRQRRSDAMTRDVALRILDSKSFRDGDFHQAIMDVCYDEWNAHDGEWTRADMLEWAKLAIGRYAKLAVMLGNYNYQVENGGHSQYFENGYASATHRGCWSDRYTDIGNHGLMIDMMRELGLDKRPTCARAVEIMERMSVPAHDSDDETYDALGELDREYYEISDDFMVELNDALGAELKASLSEHVDTRPSRGPVDE